MTRTERLGRKMSEYMVVGGVEVAFSSPARILGECSTVHFPSALFFFFFFFKMEISSSTLISLFRLGSVHSGSLI